MHQVVLDMGLPADEIFDVIKRSDRCYQTVRGYVAERHLERHLDSLKSAGVLDSVQRIDEDGQPDFRVSSRGRTATVECKNVMTGYTFASGEGKVDFQRTRDQIGQAGQAGRYYKVSDFDVLAACLWNQTGRWEFRYVRTAHLPIEVVNGIACVKKSVRVPLGRLRDPWTADLVVALSNSRAQQVLDQQG